MEDAQLGGMETEDISKIDIAFTISFIILGILLVVLVLRYGLGDCDKLKFELDNNTLDAGEFMEVYSTTCLSSSSDLLSLPDQQTSLPWNLSR